MSRSSGAWRPTVRTYVMSAVGPETVAKFDREGLHVFGCSPHYMMGMVALVVIGDKRDNLEAARSVPHNRLTQKRIEPLLAQVQ